MNDVIKVLFDEIVNILDGYRYYSKEEVKENERLFTEAIIEKDVEYINDVKALFDSEIEEEKEILNRIDELMNRQWQDFRKAEINIYESKCKKNGT